MTPVAYRIAYGLAGLLNLALGTFLVLLVRGDVPIPSTWAWAIPIVITVVTGACALLPRLGSEHLSSQVDALASAGIQKRDMVVVSKDEAVTAITSEAGTFSPAQVHQIVTALKAELIRDPGGVG